MYYDEDVLIVLAELLGQDARSIYLSDGIMLNIQSLTLASI